MTKIELGKTYRTRDGREVGIYAVDGGGDYPVLGAVRKSGDDAWVMFRWTPDGREFIHGSTGDLNLVKVRPRIKREVWVNLYRDDAGYNYYNKAAADRGARDDRIACVRLTIDCEEGEGL